MKFDEINALPEGKEKTESVKATVKEIRKRRQKMFDDLDEFIHEWLMLYGTEGMNEAVKDEIIKFYVDGFVTSTMDGRELPDPYEFLDKEYPEGKTSLGILDERISEGNEAEIKKAVESEANRMWNEGALRSGAKYKTWQTMNDTKVRETHSVLEGVKIPLNDKFYTFGDEALAPGGFELAENNANCRCWLSVE